MRGAARRGFADLVRVRAVVRAGTLHERAEPEAPPTGRRAAGPAAPPEDGWRAVRDRMRRDGFRSSHEPFP
ncbi:hypothetical protein AB0D46_15030 [Streptomyces sp. NPDC048383]|uniref:hypothetical protein n=1 Tax=Streptomyces sp. NPDC048383 TaxID=3155386 RepID=UPI003448D584